MDKKESAVRSCEPAATQHHHHGTAGPSSARHAGGLTARHKCPTRKTSCPHECHADFLVINVFWRRRPFFPTNPPTPHPSSPITPRPSIPRPVPPTPSPLALLGVWRPRLRLNGPISAGRGHAGPGAPDTSNAGFGQVLKGTLKPIWSCVYFLRA